VQIATVQLAGAVKSGILLGFRIHNVNISDEMYRRIVEAVPEGIWVVDPEGRTIFSNRRMAEILGTAYESMPGQSCFGCVFPDELADAQRHFARTLAGDTRPFEFRLWRADGSPVWVSISCMPVHGDHGAQVGMLGLFSDITERKQAEAALRESEERFRNMADTAPVMIWVSDENKQLTFFNKTWLNFTGRTMEQEQGDGWAAGVHPDDIQNCYETFCAAFDAHRNFQIELRLRRADGEYRSILCNGVPRFLPGGTFAGYIGCDIDITDLQSEERFRELAENIDQVFWMLDLETDKVLYISPSFEKVWGCSAASYRDRDWLRLVPRECESGADRRDLPHRASGRHDSLDPRPRLSGLRFRRQAVPGGGNCGGRYRPPGVGRETPPSA